jgi:hypothetical protein
LGKSIIYGAQIVKRRRGIFASAHLRPLTMTPSAAVLHHAEFLIDHLLRVMEREGVATVAIH